MSVNSLRFHVIAGVTCFLAVSAVNAPGADGEIVIATSAWLQASARFYAVARYIKGSVREGTQWWRRMMALELYPSNIM